MDNMRIMYNLTRNHYSFFQGCTSVFVTSVFVAKIIWNLKNIFHESCTVTGCIWTHATFFDVPCAIDAVLLNCTAASQIQTPLGTIVLIVVTPYVLVIFPSSLSYNYVALAVLFPTYSNTCSDRWVVRLLTLIFDSTVCSTYNKVLHVVLNIGNAKFVVIIRGDVQIVVTGPIS